MKMGNGKLMGMSLLGIPFYWGHLRIPYYEIETSKYPLLASVLSGILYVFPVYLNNAIVQGRFRDIGFLDHIFPFITTIIVGIVVLFSMNCIMVAFYWLLIYDEKDSIYRWVRARRIFSISAFYQFVLFLVLAFFWCWQILRGTGISGYYISKIILLLFTCVKIGAVFSAIRAELLFGNQHTSLAATEQDTSNLNYKLSNPHYISQCILGVLLSLDVILIWVTI